MSVGMVAITQSQDPEEETAWQQCWREIPSPETGWWERGNTKWVTVNRQFGHWHWKVRLYKYSDFFISLRGCVREPMDIYVYVSIQALVHVCLSICVDVSVTYICVLGVGVYIVFFVYICANIICYFLYLYGFQGKKESGKSASERAFCHDRQRLYCVPLYCRGQRYIWCHQNTSRGKL